MHSGAPCYVRAGEHRIGRGTEHGGSVRGWRTQGRQLWGLLPGPGSGQGTEEHGAQEWLSGEPM